MAEILSPPAISTSTPPAVAPWRLLAISVGLPALIAAVDYELLGRSLSLQTNTFQVWLQFAWYVGQVGVVSYTVGRGLTQPVLRWFVFAWVLLLVDLLSLTLALSGSLVFFDGPPSHLAPAALFAGQIGLCVVWAILGSGRWPIRLWATAFVAAVLFWLWLALEPPYNVRIWTELMILQVMTLTAMCGLLRLRRFQLRPIATETAPAADGAQSRHLQFNIKHVLMWTTALAMFLGLAKALDLLTWQAAREMAAAGLFWKLTVATASAMVIVVALWVALGQGNTIVRYSVGVLFTLAIGAGLAAWSFYNVAVNTPRPGMPWTAVQWELRALYEVGWWWLGWLFLNGGLLAATLMILRTLHYRLVRMRGK